MNEIKVFESEEFGQVRTVIVDDKPWFVGKDVATILGYAKARNAIAKHVDDEDKKDAPIQGALGGTQSMTITNESGVYSLTFSSKLQTAQKFKHWVTSEILPSIRKYGTYTLVNKLKEEREKGKNTRLTLTEALKISKENERMHGHAYAAYTDLIYKELFGKNNKQLRKELNVEKNKNVRDYFTIEQLGQLERMEGLFAGLLIYGCRYDEIKSFITSDTFTLIS